MSGSTERAPLAWAALAFAAGITLEWVWPAPAGGLFAAAALLGWRLVRSWRVPARANLFLLVLTVLLGMLRAGEDARPRADGIDRWIGEEVCPVTLRGTLVSEPAGVGRGGQPSAWLEVEQALGAQGWPHHLPEPPSLDRSKNAGPSGSGQGVGWQRASGRLLVRFPRRGGLLEFGDHLRLSGLLRPGKAGERFDERCWLWARGAEGVLSVPDAEGVARLGQREDLWARYRRGVSSFRWRLKGVGRSFLGPVEAGALEALLLGEQQGIPRRVWEAYKKTGTLHIVTSVLWVKGSPCN